MSVIVPAITSERTPGARSVPSSGVPANASYQCFRTASSPGCGASSGTTSTLGSPSRHEDDGRPNPVGAPGGAAGARMELAHEERTAGE